VVHQHTAAWCELQAAVRRGGRGLLAAQCWWLPDAGEQQPGDAHVPAAYQQARPPARAFAPLPTRRSVSHAARRRGRWLLPIGGCRAAAGGTGRPLRRAQVGAATALRAQPAAAAPDAVRQLHRLLLLEEAAMESDIRRCARALRSPCGLLLAALPYLWHPMNCPHAARRIQGAPRADGACVRAAGTT